MLKALTLTVAMGALTALPIAAAGAMPLTQSKSTIESTDLSLVRDGCGRGMRYSHRLGGCVVDNVVVAPRVVAPVVVVPRVVAPVVRACPRGTRWSNRFQQCVY